MSEKITATNSTIFVNRTIGKKAGDPEATGDEDIIAVHQFKTDPAQVEVTMALTMNLGNYESARLSVSVRVPCYKEEIDEAYKWVERFVTEKVESERNLITAHRNGKSANPL